MTTIADYLNSILKSNRECRNSILALHTNPSNAIASGFEKALPNPADRRELTEAACRTADVDVEVREVANILGIELDNEDAGSGQDAIRTAHGGYCKPCGF